MMIKLSMESKTEAIFLDTSFFKALIDKKDDFHDSAATQWIRMGQQRVNTITTNFIIDETATLLRIKCGRPSALEFRERLSGGLKSVKIMRVLVSDEKAAWTWFEKDWSKLSFTDCTSFALMKRIGLTRAAAFDDHFSRAGFTVLG